MLLVLVLALEVLYIIHYELQFITFPFRDLRGKGSYRQRRNNPSKISYSEIYSYLLEGQVQLLLVGGQRRV
jgi:hypothetical protein